MAITLSAQLQAANSTIVQLTAELVAAHTRIGKAEAWYRQHAPALAAIGGPQKLIQARLLDADQGPCRRCKGTGIWTSPLGARTGRCFRCNNPKNDS